MTDHPQCRPRSMAHLCQDGYSVFLTKSTNEKNESFNFGNRLLQLKKVDNPRVYMPNLIHIMRKPAFADQNNIYRGPTNSNKASRMYVDFFIFFATFCFHLLCVAFSGTKTCVLCR